MQVGSSEAFAISNDMDFENANGRWKGEGKCRREWVSDGLYKQSTSGDDTQESAAQCKQYSRNKKPLYEEKKPTCFVSKQD